MTPHASAAPGRYLIGVDTGGTYTDAALIEARGHRIMATAKAITTKGDLAVGVAEAMAQAMARLAQQVPAQDVAMVSVSTTLATNAVVEGHGSATGLILIGFDAAMVERTGIAGAFPDVAIATIAGGHDHQGEALCPLDGDALEAAVQAMAGKVEAFAVASAFAVRNAAHEQAARDRIVALSGKPVTLSSELSSALDAPRRALTAVLNARLIPRIAALIGAVQRAMAQLGLHCPLMIVKGDGSLALAQSVATRPIETVLSGPAASLVGAQWLSGQERFILSDMGGTTTDLGLLIDGRPQVREDGAQVGGWRTMVRAIDVRTLGLGGDSEVGLHDHGSIRVGPQRVTPVALVAARYPQLLDLLQADLADAEGAGSLHGKYVLLPFAADHSQQPTGLSAREQAVLRAVTHAPQPLRRIADGPVAQRALQQLRRKGLVQLCSLTPSDAAHVLGLQDNWSLPAATLAVQLGARLRDMREPTPERTQAFARAVWDETARLSSLAVLQTAFGMEVADNALIQAVCSGAGQLGLADVSLRPRIPVVAVGGPARVFYPEVQRRLGCALVFPEHGEVANAVGAATGVVAHSAVVHVVGDGSGLFRLHSSAQTRQFSDVAEALQAAQDLAHRLAHDAVLTMGAHRPQVRLSVHKLHLPHARDDSGLLQARVVAEALGRPMAAD